MVTWTGHQPGAARLPLLAALSLSANGKPEAGSRKGDVLSTPSLGGLWDHPETERSKEEGVWKGSPCTTREMAVETGVPPEPCNKKYTVLIPREPWGKPLEILILSPELMVRD